VVVANAYARFGTDVSGPVRDSDGCVTGVVT
jgi:hypothetical protein